ncbi:OB-fold protein [Cellulomonas sp. ATA003]|uniref:OB-fold protein n=1 Tax=Cellulomonas sp. ATA003 TaxID=3073064 RepID=UPI002872E5F6|nr:hypothetical protein [Cellulomonas sp. ATA003]WNB85156.1 hypothetical protein REH70_16150 [Cellulomonas sp. ATA003]
MSTTTEQQPPADWKAMKKAEKKARPWYKKKRFVIPLIVLALIVIGQLAGGGDETPAAEAPPAATQEDAPAEQPAAEEPAAEEPAPEPEPEPAEEPAIVVSAQEMITALEGNALNAKNTYEGKQVAISGFVGSIDASGDYFAVDPEPEAIIFTGIQAMTGEEFLDQLATLSQGQAVTVTGTVTSVGEVMGYSIETESIVGQ